MDPHQLAMALHRAAVNAHAFTPTGFDPGDTKTLVPCRWFQHFNITTAAAETRTLAAPEADAQLVFVELEVDGGDLTLTVTSGYNAAAETTLTFDDAGDWVLLHSIKVGSSYYWRVLASGGVAELGGGVDVHSLGLLGAAPATTDRLAVSDESATSDPTLAITIAELFQTYFDDMAPGTGVSAGSGTICEHRVSRVGGLYKTEILLDLTGLHGGDTAGDIIGKDGETANCHIGQITAAVNGTIIAGRITCFETPAGGDPDVDLYGSADEATGAQDAALTTLTGEAKLCDHGDWTAEDVDYLSALPDADGYLYLVQGDATDAAYSAGIFLIELWGK